MVGRHMPVVQIKIFALGLVNLFFVTGMMKARTASGDKGAPNIIFHIFLYYFVIT